MIFKKNNGIGRKKKEKEKRLGMVERGIISFMFPDQTKKRTKFVEKSTPHEKVLVINKL